MASKSRRSSSTGTLSPDVGVHPEPDPLLAEEFQPPVQDPLLQLELGDPVAQEAPDPVGPLEDRDPVAGAVELLRRRQSGRPGADHRHLLPGAAERRLGRDPPGLEGAVDDRQLDGLDRHRIVVDPQDAGAFARRGAQRPGELGEIIRGVEAVAGLPPAVPVHQVVPVRDDVPQGAALVAEGDAAIHAARALLLEHLRRMREHDLLPVPDPLLHRPVGLLGSLDFQETGQLTHGRLPSPPRSQGIPSASARFIAATARL